MSFEMAMLMNWLLVAAGLLGSDLFSGWFDDSSSNDDDDDDVLIGENLGLGDGNDDYVGTTLNDIILGQAGDDSIDGGAGDDVIEGNTEDDVLSGGAGNDVLAGGGDNDTLYGGEGNDVLSTDRVDQDAEWARGSGEQLDGGAGDDRLYFADDAVVTGGEGADSFGMIETGEGVATVTDFTSGEDDVVIYIDGLDEAEASPIISYNADEEAGTTTVSLDGEPTLVFDGVFTPEELGVTLADTNTIIFEAKEDDLA